MLAFETMSAVAALALTFALQAQDPKTYQSMEWRNIGPFRGGRSVAVAGIPNDTQTYYMGSVGGGLWKTNDAGENWRNITDGFLKTSSVGAVAIAPSDPNVIYLGMGEHSVRGVATSHGDGVYKSTDAGRTWKHIGLDRTRAISRIRIHPTNPDIVYVGAQGAPYGPTKDRGIYRSKDGGKTWELLLAGANETSGCSELAMDPRNPRILYATFWDHLRQPWEVRSGGPGSGIFKSTDSGDTWKPIDSGLPKLTGKIGIDVASNSDRLYAIVEADPDGGLYRSENAGATWTLQNATWGIKSRAWYYMEVFADPTNSDVLWVLNAGIHRSIDGGKTFTEFRAPHGDHHDLWINPSNPDILINANDGGANISFTGGRTWSTQDNQPTAQFYRVNTDDRFPYWVYGGQQDNTSVGIASRVAGPGISWKDWYPVGGCESAYVDFDRKDPRRIYAGCYMGIITEFDNDRREARDIMHYPSMPAALPSREMKYRFNWNAPILVSKHDPKVIYHASQILLRSEDRGLSWKEISPDLTKPDDKTQGPGGGPITNEGAGGETYNTIHYAIESPHDKNTLYTGSDDGQIHLTRDGGKTWKKLPLPEVDGAQINAIEVSPHDAGTAYLAATRYKFNDFTPHFFKTTDFGATWTRIVDGIPADSWARVVREDPVRKGLLYAGTETGAFVSFNGGEKWQPLQMNLPLTPVTDLQVHGNDLVAATSGRAFWILDDLSPLRQAKPLSEVHLFKPAKAIRTSLNFATPPNAPRLGKNPPAGAAIDFYIPKVEGSKTTLEILNGKNELRRKFPNLTLKDGMNRIVWDLRHDKPVDIPGLFLFVTLNGRKVPPGKYTVKLRSAGVTKTETIEVVKDPRIETTQDQFDNQYNLVTAIEKELVDIHQSVIRLRKVRDQVDDLTKRAAQPEVEAAGKDLSKKLTEMEDILIQKKTVDGQTVINFPVKLNHHYAHLRSTVDGPEGPPTAGSRQRLADLNKQWTGHKADLAKLLGDNLKSFNQLVRQKEVQPVVLPPQ